MAKNRKEEQEIYVDIPVNYDEGFHLLGQTLKRRNIIDAIVIAAVFGAITFSVLYYVFYLESIMQIWIYTGIVALVGFFIGAAGRNGDPFSIYVMYKIKHFARRRITMYNSRIKYEKIAEQQKAYEQEDPLNDGKETSQSNWNKFVQKMSERTKNITAQTENAENVEESYVFEDDIGYSNSVPEEIEKQFGKQKKGGFRFGKGKEK